MPINAAVKVPAEEQPPERKQLKMEPTMDIEEVCAVLRVSHKTVRKLCAEGKLKFQKVGLQYRFRRAWVEAYLDE